MLKIKYNLLYIKYLKINNIYINIIWKIRYFVMNVIENIKTVKI